MMPIVFEIPGTGLKIFGFGLMLFLALMVGLRIASWRARREGLDPDLVYDLAFWVVVGGLVGARGFYVLQHRETIDSPLEILAFWQGGIVLYGSAIGALLALLICYLRRPFPILAVLDAVAPTLAIGIALGRVGCFLNGCCYGDVCDLPWAVQFPAHTLPWVDQVRQGVILATDSKSLPVHPTQLYSTIDGFVLFGLLTAYFPVRRRDGEVIGVMLLAYPIARFLIERLRDDERGIVAGLTISQAISLLIFAGGVAYWVWLMRRPVGTLASRSDETGPLTQVAVR